MHGIVDEVDGDIINVYFLSEKNYVKRKNDEDFEIIGIVYFLNYRDGKLDKKNKEEGIPRYFMKV